MRQSAVTSLVLLTSCLTAPSWSSPGPGPHPTTLVITLEDGAEAHHKILLHDDTQGNLQIQSKAVVGETPATSGNILVPTTYVEEEVEGQDRILLPGAHHEILHHNQKVELQDLPHLLAGQKKTAVAERETQANPRNISKAIDAVSEEFVVDITDEASAFNELDANPRALTILDMIRDQEPDENGRKCVDKMMQRRETVYEEVMRCDHSYDERCHTTYVTSYVPHQEEDCDEKFRKVCMIWNEQQAVTEMVEECTTPLVPNCLQPGPEVCRTVYDTVCDTKQVGYEVEEQFPNCVTVNMEKCKDVTIGLVTENKCEVWPVQQCEVENRTVTHTQPRTDCRKEPRELCAPGDCPLEEVSTLLSPVCSFNDRLCPGPRCLCSEDEDCRG